MRDEHPDKRVELWVQDEARFGQQGSLTSVWALKGSRPTAVKQTEYDWLYLFAAVCPRTGESCAIVAPTVSTAVMSQHLRMIGEQVGPDRHVILVLDNAGWHRAKALEVPANVTLLFLPPYAPELNPAERVWDYLKSHYLSNRAYADYDELFGHACASWNRLDEACLKSITEGGWVTRAIEG